MFSGLRMSEVQRAAASYRPEVGAPSVTIDPKGTDVLEPTVSEKIARHLKRCG
jgi:hypothetical protein